MGLGAGGSVGLGAGDSVGLGSGDSVALPARLAGLGWGGHLRG